MIRAQLQNLRSGTTQLAGATAGQADRKLIVEQLRPHRVTDEPTLVVLDFTGIEFATASYLKMLAFWLQDAGRLFADGVTPQAAMAPSDPLPLDIFPILFGLNPEVSEEFDVLLRRHDRVFLEALEFDGEHVVRVRVHGALDRSLVWTLRLLTELKQATAPMLHERFGAEQGTAPGSISVNAWNNRLTELYRLRFASRTKVGRFWLYRPVTQEIVNG